LTSQFNWQQLAASTSLAFQHSHFFALCGKGNRRSQPAHVARDEHSSVGDGAATGWDDSARRLHEVLLAACADHARSHGSVPAPSAGQEGS